MTVKVTDRTVRINLASAGRVAVCRMAARMIPLRALEVWGHMLGADWSAEKCTVTFEY